MNDLDLITHLRTSGQTKLPPENVRKIRQELLAEFDRVTSEQELRSREARGFFHLLTKRPMFTTAIATLILVLGLGTTTVTANTAKPGDVLFGWDRAAERTRLAFTFGEEAKVNYQAKIAEERIQERLKLESQHSEHAVEAAEISNQTVDDVLANVVRIRTRLESEGSSDSATFIKLETRLRELRGENEDRLQIEAQTENGKTKVNVEAGRSKWEWTTSATTRTDLIIEITAKTGLPIDAVDAALTRSEFDQRSDDSPSDQDTDDRDVDNNVNGNIPNKINTNVNTGRDDGRDDDRDESRNTNTNTSSNSTNNSTNRSDDENDDRNTNEQKDNEQEIKTSIRVRVDLDEGKTEIRTEINNQEQEWEIFSTSQAEILASITARTGLSNLTITSVWDFEQE